MSRFTMQELIEAVAFESMRCGEQRPSVGFPAPVDAPAEELRESEPRFAETGDYVATRPDAAQVTVWCDADFDIRLLFEDEPEERDVESERRLQEIEAWEEREWLKLNAEQATPFSVHGFEDLLVESESQALVSIHADEWDEDATWDVWDDRHGLMRYEDVTLLTADASPDDALTRQRAEERLAEELELQRSFENFERQFDTSVTVYNCDPVKVRRRLAELKAARRPDAVRVRESAAAERRRRLASAALTRVTEENRRRLIELVQEAGADPRSAEVVAWVRRKIARKGGSAARGYAACIEQIERNRRPGVELAA